MKTLDVVWGTPDSTEEEWLCGWDLIPNLGARTDIFYKFLFES